MFGSGTIRLVVAVGLAGILCVAAVAALLVARPVPSGDGEVLRWIGWVALVALALGLPISLFVWMIASPTTRERYLHSGGLRRIWRGWRSLWLRAGLTIVSWPHLADLAVGTRRTAVGATPAEVVWRSGTVSLTRYAGERTHHEPVLLVHALVTRPWIFDLTPSRSVVGRLVGEGFDVFLLDWGDPSAADADRGLADCVAALMSAEDAVRELTGQRRLHLVAYCLASVVCLARLGAAPHPGVASMFLIAPPVDFAVLSGFRHLLGRTWLRPAILLDSDGLVPAAAVREAFHLLRPQALRTIFRRLTRPMDTEAKQFYGALARWIWEQRRLPGRLFFEIVDLYRSDGLEGSTLRWRGGAVDLSRISVPVMAALAARDHVVPAGSSQALAAVNTQVEVLTCPRGHVSMLVGSTAESHLLPGLSAWLLARAKGRRTR